MTKEKWDLGYNMESEIMKQKHADRKKHKDVLILQ